MNTFYKYFILFISLFSIIACNHNMKIEDYKTKEFNISIDDINYKFERKLLETIQAIDSIDEFSTITAFQSNYPLKDTLIGTSVNSSNIIFFDENLSEIQNLNVNGLGPEEFLNPYCSIVSMDSLIFSDAGQNSIKTFNYATKKVNTILSGIDFFSFGHYANAFIYLPNTPSEKSIDKLVFKKKYFDSNKTETIDLSERSNLEQNDFMSFAYQGEFRQNQDYVSYFGWYTSEIFIFNNRLDYHKTLKTIYDVKQPKPLKQKVGNYQALNINREKMINLDMSIDDKNNIFILSNMGKNDFFYIDCYNLDKNKSYLGSFGIKSYKNQKPTTIFRYDDRLVVLYEDFAFKIFKIKL